MSGPKVASGTGSAIPASDRKLISRLKEIVSNSEEEIYAMLNECNRDPDETVQRLLNEEKFHVVKRKRDKKKENTGTKEGSDSRSSFSSSGPSNRSGRNAVASGRGVGRGNTSLKEVNGRSKVALSRESGVPPSKSSIPASGAVSYSQSVQPKSSFSDSLNGPLLPSVVHSNGDSSYSSQASALQGSWPAGLGTASPAALQGAWLAGAGRGQGTIADMLKSGAARLPNSSVSQIGNVVSRSAPAPMTSASPESDMYVTSSSVPLSAYDSIGQNTAILPKPDSVYTAEPRSNFTELLSSDDQTIESSPSASLGAQFEDTDEVGHPLGLVESSRLSSQTSSHAATLVNQFSSATVYTGQHYVEIPHDVEEQDDGSGVEADEIPLDNVTSSTYTDSVSAASVKLQDLSLRDEPVIIPDHLRVSDADCTKLSFGSFESGVEGLSVSFASESKSPSFSVGEVIVDNESVTPSEAPTLRSASLAPSSGTQADLPATVSNLESPAVSTTQSDSLGLKPEEATQERPQHEYLVATSYAGANLASQSQESQYLSEDSRAQDVTRLSSVLQPYSDPATTYYSGVFRSSPEAEARYAAFLPSAATGKYGAIRPSATEQSTANQEATNAMVFQNHNTIGQALQSANVPTVQQQSLPIHPYPTQPSAVHLSPFTNVLSYPYMPPGFSYVQSPYQHNYVGTANAMKYSMPQYKPGASMGVGIHNTVTPGASGYGGYANSQPGAHSLNHPVTAGNASSFDEVAAQYKDNSIYIPSQQQVEGSSNWLQAPLSREMPGGSYYNMHGQNQPARYSQAQSLNAHSLPGAVYSNPYRPQQSGSSPNAHQLLQQHQVLGSVSALGTQIGTYQQAQRAQQSWANGF